MSKGERWGKKERGVRVLVPVFLKYFFLIDLPDSSFLKNCNDLSGVHVADHVYWCLIFLVMNFQWSFGSLFIAFRLQPHKL